MTLAETLDVELIEWRWCDVADDVGQRLARAHNKDFEVERTLAGGFRVRAKNLIGVIPLDGLVVRVTPKLPIVSLVAMLEEVYDLKSFKIYDVLTPMEDVTGLVDRFAALFAARVLSRLRMGVLRTYVVEGDELLTVRGRVDVAGSIRATVGARPYLYCEFEELTADIPDNQILLAALHVLVRCGTLSPKTKAQVVLAYRTLGSDVGLVEVRPAECIGRSYDRLNRDYQPLHLLARFFLERAAVDLGSRRDTLPFTINTAYLFEAFVARWLARHLPEGRELETQHQLDVSADGRFESYVDLVLRREGKSIAVLDTKYKDAENVSPSDLHQIVYYATALGCSTAILVYPCQCKPIQVTVGAVRVRSLAFDLSVHPRESGSKFLADLSMLIDGPLHPPEVGEAAA